MDAVDWLLESDPSIRWQALRDLTDATDRQVADARAKVAIEGWAVQLLAAQSPAGTWGTPDGQSWATSPEWSCLMALMWLREMGLDPNSEQARQAVERVRDNITWRWWGDRPFFHGEVEPCINGRVLALAAYFGQDSRDLIARLLGEQMADGGWNCEQENGSTRGSFHSTINVLEGLLEVDQANSDDMTPAVRDARLRGEEYLLERRLARRISTGEIVDPDITQLSFPYSYHYDVLRGLDYFRRAGRKFDERMAEALEIVTEKRRTDARWVLEVVHDDLLDVDFGERQGYPSRWLTLHALGVLRWAGSTSAPS